MRNLLIVVALLITAGCGPWIKTESPFTSETYNFTVDLPQGWMRSNTDKILLITRDGILLQRIVISRINLSDEKQFSYTKKRVTAGMLPQEVAEVVIDNLQSDSVVTFGKIEENAPAMVAGKPGFRVQVVYSTKEGLNYRFICYGMLSGDYLYRIMYLAPVRYYFDKDLSTFENVVRSFRLTK